MKRWTKRAPAVAAVALAVLSATARGGEAPWEVERELGSRRLVHRSTVEGVGFSADGRIVVAAANDGEIGLWDAQTGELRKAVRHEGQALALAMAPAGDRACVVGFDAVSMWGVPSGERIAYAKIPSDRKGLSVAFSPDGARVAIGSFEGVVSVLDAATLDVVWTAPFEQGGWVVWVGFGADGARVYAAGGQHVRAYAAGDGAPIPEAAIECGNVSAAVLLGEGEVATMSEPGVGLQLWDLGSGERRRLFRQRSRSEMTCTIGGETFEPGESPVMGSSLGATADGRHLLVGTDDDRLLVLDAGSGRKVADLHGHARTFYGESIPSIAIAPDGRTCATGGADHMVRLWDLGTGLPLVATRGHRGAPHEVALSPDGGVVATGGEDGTVRLTDASSGRLVRVLRRHRGPIHAMAFSEDGARLVTIDWQGVVKLWEVATGALLLERDTADGSFVGPIAFVPGQERFIIGSDEPVVMTFAGETARILRGHEGYVNTLAVTPDGSRAITSSRDGTVRIWDLASGEALHVIQATPKDRWEPHVSVLPGGARVLIATDRTLDVYDVSTGERLARHEGKGLNGTPTALADGRRVIVSGWYGVSLFDLEEGRFVQTLARGAGLFGVSAAADGRRIAIGRSDGTITLLRPAE